MTAVKKNDARLSPILTVSVAAELIDLPVNTLYSWLRKSPTRQQVIHGVVDTPRGWPALSVIGLAEAHTARALREHGWSMHQIARFTEQKRKLEPFPLAIPRLLTDEIDVFIEHDDELSRLWDSQIPFSDFVRPYLRELVPWDDKVTGSYRPSQLEPELALAEIDPRFNGGRVSFRRNRVPLFAVVGALRAGDTISEVAASYRLSEEEVGLLERHHGDWGLLQAA